MQFMSLCLFVAAFACGSLVWGLCVGVVGFSNSADDSGDMSVCLFVGFELFMESLILAQDERWRRA